MLYSIWCNSVVIIRNNNVIMDRMVPVSPARTGLLRIDVMGRTYITSFPGSVSQMSFEQHLVIHNSGKYTGLNDNGICSNI